MTVVADFDWIARPYRWLEYVTLGPMLQRCRTYFLPQIAGCEKALVLGDGDGRFLAKLMAQNLTLQADAVDTSGTMLELLTLRVDRTTPGASMRLRTHHGNALEFVQGEGYDLVVTHFLLDCLVQEDVEKLVASVRTRMQPGAVWLISDFRTPEGFLEWPSRVLIRSLYLAFRMATGLRTSRLPDYATSLVLAGFVPVEEHLLLGGLLTTAIWKAA